MFFYVPLQIEQAGLALNILKLLLFYIFTVQLIFLLYYFYKTVFLSKWIVFYEQNIVALYTMQHNWLILVFDKKNIFFPQLKRDTYSDECAQRSERLVSIFTVYYKVYVLCLT